MSAMSKRIVVVLAGTALAFIMGSAVALAAPVLSPGTTSAPGMSGTCTDCHTYSTPAPAPAPAPKPKPAPKPALPKGSYLVYGVSLSNGRWAKQCRLYTTRTHAQHGLESACVWSVSKAGKVRFGALCSGPRATALLSHAAARGITLHARLTTVKVSRLTSYVAGL